MSFDEWDDAFVWRCDDCHLTVEFPARDFYSCVAELKARGWQMIRDRGIPKAAGGRTSAGAARGRPMPRCSIDRSAQGLGNEKPTRRVRNKG